jgi:hypothetical protein
VLFKNRLNPQGSGGFFMEERNSRQKISAKYSLFSEVNSHLNQQNSDLSATDFKSRIGLPLTQRADPVV